MQALVGIAVRSGGLRARDISYVAVHGTGTPLGDPIEVGALAAALAPDGSQMSGAVALGSVKVRDFGSINNQYELHHLVSKPCLIISGPPSSYHAELLHSTIQRWYCRPAMATQKALQAQRASCSPCKA